MIMGKLGLMLGMRWQGQQGQQLMVVRRVLLLQQRLAIWLVRAWMRQKREA
jgi:hypothetical protein